MRKILLIILILFFIRISNLSASNEKTNFIIFIADDISWDDFGCYGNKQVKTPNIDNLAKHGIKFTNTYLTASSCSPSRNSILTGRYPHNTGAAELHTQPPLEMISMPEVLKANGYFTALSGKWHIGDYGKRSFDVISKEFTEIGNSGSDSWVKVLHERPKNKPFFMWFASLDAHRDWGENQYSGTHNPDSIIPPFYLHNGTKTRNDLSKYYDEVYRFDVRIGEVIAELKEQGVLENTLIIIMSDNGRPFPHSKTRVNDKGMKTPFIVFWPAEVKVESQVSNSLISAVDIAPTVLDVAKIKTPESFQGKSFLPIIMDPSKDFRNFVFAEHNWHDYEAHERMVRSKDYMYILNSRPNLSQSGPADAVSSPSFQELLELKETGKLSAAQVDIFVIPRPNEELFDYNNDSLQLFNIASVPEYMQVKNEMNHVLQQWMEETGDNIPDNITKDWYLRIPGYIGTEAKEVRGEMPGTSRNAVKINSKGPF